MDSNFKQYEVMAKKIMRDAPRIHQRTLDVNILAFADTHYGFTKREDIEHIYDKYHDADIVALLGDHHPYFIDLVLQYFPAEIIVPILGNHDLITAYRDFGLKELQGSILEIKGVTIGGISGAHKYKCSNRYSLITQEDSLKLCEKLLHKPAVDIFLSHDICFVKNMFDIAHCGVIGNTKYIFSNKDGPVVHLHGHIHKPYSRYYTNGTKEISVYGVEYLSL